MGRTAPREFWRRPVAALDVAYALLADAEEILAAARDTNERALAVHEHARRTLASAKVLRERAASDAMLVRDGHDRAARQPETDLVSAAKLSH